MNKIVVDRDALLDNLQKLIRIESVNPSLVANGQGEAEIAKYIGEYLSEIGLEVRYQETAPGRLNVIGILKGNGSGKSLMLNGHTDTVSINGMSINPFDPHYTDGRVYGRGSLDMKAGVAAAIAAAKAVAESGLQLKGDVILTFVADEEYASIGTEAVVREYTADAAIVCEPSALGLGIAHKGFAWITIDILGKAAHGSRPDQGIDAIVKAGKVLVAIEALGNKLSGKKHELLGSPSVHASLINGGTELSTYPDLCQIQIERRTIPGEDKNTVIAEMQEILDGIAEQDPQFKADFKVFFYRPHFEVAETEPIAKSVARAFKQVVSTEPQLTGFSGWLDSSILAEAGIPTVIFGPAGEGLHANKEYVEFESVVITAEVLAETIVEYCG